MKSLINFLKGICIGVANVIPGFSGGTMAVMLNIYDLFIYAFANIFNDFKKVVKDCWSLFVGILVGIIVAMVVILKLLEVIPLITIMFFVGLIIGTIPQIIKKARVGKFTIIDGLCFIIAIGILVTLPLIHSGEAAVTINVGLYFLLFVLGIVCASAMVIPGVSGSLVLMAFGYYNFVLGNIKDFLANLFAFSSSGYWNRILLILCFALGCVIGIVFVSKLISKLMVKHPKTVYVTILGLLFASPFSIIYSTMKDYPLSFNAINIVFSVVSLALGIGLVFLANYMQKKYEVKQVAKEGEASENIET